MKYSPLSFTIFFDLEEIIFDHMDAKVLHLDEVYTYFNLYLL
jgi:hypothetical protein